MSDRLEFLYITGKPDVAELAIRSGADVIMVDLERLGKSRRQAGRNTWISDHTVEDVRRVIETVGSENVLVRTDPFNEASSSELEQLLAAGAKHFMQPMFQSTTDVVNYCKLLPEGVSVLPLAETASAVDCLPALASIAQVEDVHIGLNDLQISMNTEFMFEPISTGFLDIIAKSCHAAALGFGFGGIARIGEGVVPPEYLLAVHVKLKSKRVILSRTFRSGDGSDDEIARRKTFARAVDKIRQRESELRRIHAYELDVVIAKTRELIDSEIHRRRKVYV